MNKQGGGKIMFLMQLASLLGIWGLMIGVIAWMGIALMTAFELDDVPTATVVITIVAMLVFAGLAGVLTYTFVGIQMGREEVGSVAEEESK